MLSPACIRSKPLLMSSRLSVCVIIGSMAIFPSMGPNYPAMALVEVKGLVESAAKVEIETTAVVEEE